MASVRTQGRTVPAPGEEQTAPPAAQPSPAGDGSWETLDRQDWHLWMLSVLLMLVLGASLLSFMFPTAFWVGEEQLPLRGSQRAFFGFLILLALALVYMLQRQATVRRLKRQLFQARAAALAAQRRAALQALVALPDRSQFRDALAMEYRRASTADGRLAVVLFGCEGLTREQIGDASYTLRYMLRRGESVFRVSEDSLGVILPGMESDDAAIFAALARERIAAQVPDAGLRVEVIGYPQEAGSLAEFEARLRAVLP